MLKVREDIPEDVKVAIETFIQQALIVEEYNLDFMPSEYMANLMETLSNYPEYTDVVLELIDILTIEFNGEKTEREVKKT